MDVLQRIKDLEASGMEYGDAYDQAVQEDEWNKRDFIEAHLDYLDGNLG